MFMEKHLCNAFIFCVFQIDKLHFCRHTAARQNNYNSVIMLLARGADVTVINKSGESAIDCALQTGSCYNAIALNVHLLGIKDDVKLHQKCILTK